MAEIRDYKGNSHKSKQQQAEREKRQPIASGKVKKKSKLAGAIIQEDVHSIKSYVVMDVLIPAVKKAIDDVVANGIHMLLYGSTNPNRKGHSNHVAYDRFSRNNGGSTSSSQRYSVDDIILESRDDAEEVIETMDGIIDTYGIATVADLFELVNITGNYTDNKYGWSSVRNFDIVRDADGYRLKLPKATPIDR